MREHLGVAGKMMARTVHPMLANRTGDQRVNFATHRHLRAGHNVVIRGAGAFHRWMRGAKRTRRKLRRGKYTDAADRTNRSLTGTPLARNRYISKPRGCGAHRVHVADNA